MKDIKALFFDLDGTLLDTFESNFEAYRRAIESVGRKTTREAFAPTFGKRVDVFLPELFPDITDDEIQRIKTEKARILPEVIHLAKPNRQLIDFVRTVRESHITALVTTATKPNALTAIEALHIKDLFDLMVTGDEVIKPKPHPEAYKLALERAGVQADEALAFEDSVSGLDAAHAANIATIRIKIPGSPDV